jgi:hypothetical protein
MYEFPCPSPVTVALRLAAGGVELRAEQRDTATVEIVPSDESDAATEAASQTRVELAGDILSIKTPEGTGWMPWRAPRIRVYVKVPTGSSVDLRAAATDVICHGEWSEVRLNTASGDAYVERVTGDLSANAASGDVRAIDVGGKLSVKTASGDVSAQRVADAASVTTASGNVQLEEVGGDVSVKSASGNTSVRAARRGTLRVNSVAGDVSVGVVSGTGVWLDLHSVFGNTRSDLDVTAAAGGSRHELTVHVRTVSGRIDVHRLTERASA